LGKIRCSAVHEYNTTAVKLTDKERGDSVIEGEMFSDVGTLGHFNCI